MPQQEDGTSVLLLDASGFDEYIKFTRSLSQLCILISSTIIYNDTVTEKVTNSLEVLLMEIQTLKLNFRHLPQFIYLLRDVEKGDETDSHIRTVLHENNIFQSFINLKYCSLPKPQLDEKGNVDFAKSIEYTKSLKGFKDNVLFRNLPDKNIGIININGDILLYILQHYIEAINKSQTPNIFQALKRKIKVNIKKAFEKSKAQLSLKVFKKGENTVYTLSNILMDINKLVSTLIRKFYMSNALEMNISLQQIVQYTNMSVQNDIFARFQSLSKSYEELHNNFEAQPIKIEETTVETVQEFFERVTQDLLDDIEKMLSFSPFTTTHTQKQFENYFTKQMDGIKECFSSLAEKNKELKKELAYILGKGEERLGQAKTIIEKLQKESASNQKEIKQLQDKLQDTIEKTKKANANCFTTVKSDRIIFNSLEIMKGGEMKLLQKRVLNEDSNKKITNDNDIIIEDEISMNIKSNSNLRSRLARDMENDSDEKNKELNLCKNSLTLLKGEMSRITVIFKCLINKDKDNYKKNRGKLMSEQLRKDIKHLVQFLKPFKT